APTNDLERKLCDAAAKVLKQRRVGIEDDFFQLGGDSIATMAFLAEVNLDDLTAADIFNGCNIKNIAKIYTDKMEKRKGVSAEEYEMNARKNAYPLFDIQTSFVDVQLNSPKHPVFNITACYTFEDVSIAQKVADALNKVIDSSPIFSTVFTFDENSNLVEKYNKDLHSDVEVEKTTEDEFVGIKKEFLSHFKKILNAPLYRCGIYVTEKCGYLMVLFHHGIIDGMGVQVFLQRFAAAYAGDPLPMDTFYSCLAREVETKESEAYREAEKYMKATYGSSEWSVNLDVDKTDGINEMGISFCPVSLTREQMDAFEKRTSITRNQLFEAVLLIAMGKLNGKKNVIMSMAFHNRVDYITKNALGVMIRKVPAALNLDKYKNAEEMFKSLQQQAMNTIRHCIYEWVIPHESPVVNDYITMAYETSDITDGGSMKKIGLQPYPCMTDDSYAPVRMFLQVMDTPKGINPLLVYSKQFYSEEIIERFAKTISEVTMKLINAESMKDLSIDELYG
ncbi:condensation domain-containing protein, partial [Fibrobacter sp.]|uniref:condensation domain-containing protein n=1 Tax=Fibrobacter sp. TaxID=35828 RepID=UPI00389028D9